MAYRFGAFEVDQQSFTLQRGGTVIPLRPKMYDVLVYLIDNRDRVVTNQELLDAIWAPEHVVPSVVHWTISRLRTALGQPRGSQDPIETTPRRGYRFSAKLVAEARGEETSRPARLRSQPSPAAVPGSAPAEGQFLGRESVLQHLSSALASARSGRGGFYLLSGEPGIGKSRCAVEFAARAAQHGRTWFGICAQGPGAPPLWPWIQILRSCAENEPTSSPLRAESHALLASLRADPGESEPGPAAARTPALLERLQRFVLEAARVGSRVIVLDDLRDADESSLELLTLLTPQVASSRLLIVATLRQRSLDLRGGHSHRYLHSLRSQAHVLELAPWSRREVAELVAHSFPAQSAEPLVELVWRRSGGNPLFAQELVRLQQARESEHAVASAASSPARFSLPVVVQDLARQDLQQLGTETIAALSAASVIGRSFDLALLGRVTQRPPAALLGSLEPALRLGIVEGTDRASEYAFRHELIREAVYMELTGGDRSRLHGVVGEALEDPMFGAVSASVLAWHFYCAAPIGHAAQAVRYAMRAARDARRTGAHSEEARYCEWALEAQAFCHEFDAEERCKVLIALGLARRELGEEDAARRLLARAIEIAQARNLPHLLTEAAIALRPSPILPLASTDTLALRALEEARRALPESELKHRGRAAAYLSSFLPYSHQPREQQALLQEAADLATASGDEEAVLDALRAKYAACLQPERVLELMAQAREVEGRAARIGARSVLLEAQTYRYLGLLQLGQPDDANALLDDLLHALEQRSWSAGAPLLRHLDARRHFLAGRFAQALERYTKLRAYRPQPEMMEFHDLSGTALIHLELGTSAAFWPRFVGALPVWRRRSLSYSGVSVRMLLDQGRIEEARTDLERIPIESLRRHFFGPGRLGMLAHFALGASALGDEARCRVLYEELRPHEHLHAITTLWYSLGSVGRYLGVLARALGDRRAAQAHFEEAARRDSACGYRPNAAWSQLGLAQILATAPDAASRRRSVLLFETCEKEARELGMAALIDELARQREPGRH